MLDLFCGRWGWSKAFAARGWECVGVDLVAPPDTPPGCEFICSDILSISVHAGRFYCTEMWGDDLGVFDFICASSSCEEFSLHGMKHFHPNPKYPENGIKLFEHTRSICEASGVPYVMENVRAAQQFVGNAVHHCGPFYLWGSGVPPLIPRQTWKHTRALGGHPEVKAKQLGITVKELRRQHEATINAKFGSAKYEQAAITATIPPELANTVAAYAERICENRGVVA